MLTTGTTLIENRNTHEGHQKPNIDFIFSLRDMSGDPCIAHNQMATCYIVYNTPRTDSSFSRRDQYATTKLPLLVCLFIYLAVYAQIYTVILYEYAIVISKIVYSRMPKYRIEKKYIHLNSN